MPWLPNTRGRGAWKFKGVLISEDDALIPDFKYCEWHIKDGVDESTLDRWCAIININQSSGYLPYNSIAHLENTILTGKLGIEIRTAMEYCRANNIPIESKFDLIRLGTYNVYKQMKNVPIYKNY